MILGVECEYVVRLRPLTAAEAAPIQFNFTYVDPAGQALTIPQSERPRAML